VKEKDMAVIGALLGATALYVSLSTDPGSDEYPRGGGSSGAMYSLPVGAVEKKASVKTPSPVIYNIKMDAPELPAKPSISEVTKAIEPRDAEKQPVKKKKRKPSPPPVDPEPKEAETKKEQKTKDEEISPYVQQIVNTPSYMLDTEAKEIKKEALEKKSQKIPIMDEYMYTPPDQKPMINPWGFQRA